MQEYSSTRYQPSVGELWTAEVHMTVEQYQASREREINQAAEYTASYLQQFRHTAERRWNRLTTSYLDISPELHSNSEFFNFVVTTTRDFKLGLLHSYQYKDNIELNGDCLNISSLFAHWFNNKLKSKFRPTGAEMVTVSGSFLHNTNDHYWNQIGSRVIDLTVLQFEKWHPLPEVIQKSMEAEVTVEGVYVSTNVTSPLYNAYQPREYLLTDIGVEGSATVQSWDPK